jgi:RHS repeat-associated protein
MIVRIDYPQSGVRLDLWGGTSGAFAGLDRFGRVTDQRWQNNTASTPADIDRYQYGYDRDSNRQYKANVVGTPVVSGGLDEYYAYDRLNRLTQMQRGVLNSGKTGISGTPAREMDWTLDPTGNWPGYVTRTSGTTDLSQARTSNPVNEITAIAESTGPSWVVPAYDAAGNTTTMPQVDDPTQSFTATYDAWNRMTAISAGGSTVATYGYDGHNRRIVKATTATSETRHFYYTDQWQDIEERTGSPATMERQYVWGIRYVDELVCRDRTGERLYAMQDANFNVAAITNTSGAVQERYRYDPYGNSTYMTASWSVLSSSGEAWQINHQALLQDVESQLVYNRNRMMHPMLAAFLSRDPLEFLDDVNFYVYERLFPIGSIDPFGYACCEYDNLTAEQICDLATKNGVNANAGGEGADAMVICSDNCNTRTICVFKKRIVSKVKRIHGGETQAGYDIIVKCLKAHEQAHKGSKNTHCPADCCGPLVVSETKQNAEELAAYKVQLKCLNDSIKDCNSDPGCIADVQREINAVTDKISQLQASTTKP